MNYTNIDELQEKKKPLFIFAIKYSPPINKKSDQNVCRFPPTAVPHASL